MYLSNLNSPLESLLSQSSDLVGLISPYTLHTKLQRFSSKSQWEILCSYKELLKTSLQLWKKVVVCMEDKTAFFADSCVVCEALYTFFWPSISVYAHKQLKNLLRLVQYLKLFVKKFALFGCMGGLVATCTCEEKRLNYPWTSDGWNYFGLIKIKFQLHHEQLN